MVQSLEAVLTTLQKIYQIKSMDLEKLQKEAEIKKIAFVITHLKDEEEISTFDLEKLNAFLAHINPEMNLENVALACSVVSVTENPAIKMGKRYQDALELLRTIRTIAEEYLELQRDLPIHLADCEKSLAEMEDLFNVLANKVIVEDIDKYLDILENELFPNDIHTVLTVVAAIVIRNATILETTDWSEKVELASSFQPAEQMLSEQDQMKLTELQAFVWSMEDRYESKKGDTVTNIYLKNIESLVDRKKISMDEANGMLRTGDMFEYFLWNWMNKLVAKIEKSNNKKDIEDAFKQIETLKAKYEEIVNVVQVESLSEIEEIQPKEIIYNISSGVEDDAFHCEAATPETLKLIEQLRSGNDTRHFANVSSLDNDLYVITGDTEFLLFKKMPNNHNLILLNGTIDEMDNKLSEKRLGKLVSGNILTAINDIIIKNDSEYSQLTSLTAKVEEIFAEKGLKTVA